MLFCPRACQTNKEHPNPDHPGPRRGGPSLYPRAPSRKPRAIVQVVPCSAAKVGNSPRHPSLHTRAALIWPPRESAAVDRRALVVGALVRPRPPLDIACACSVRPFAIDAPARQQASAAGFNALIHRLACMSDCFRASVLHNHRRWSLAVGAFAPVFKAVCSLQLLFINQTNRPGTH